MKLDFTDKLGDKVVSDLPFMPQPELNNLCAAYLVSVEVKMYEVALTTKKGQESKHEYKGHTIPQLEFKFKQIAMGNVVGDRFYTHRERPIGTLEQGRRMQDDTISKIYMGQFTRIKHIFDAFDKCPSYKPLSKLPAIDPFANIEDRIVQTTAYYQAWADAFNKGINDQAIYTNYPVLIKLVANSDQSTLILPEYVNRGYIAPFDLKTYQAKKIVATTLQFYGSETVTLVPRKRATSSDDISSTDDDIANALSGANIEA